VVGSTRY